MISGVFLILLGEAMVLGSKSVVWWPVLFMAINALYIPLVEEPELEARHGQAYRVYRANVPRWMPRWKAWRQSPEGH
jgi:protein-S-isoprenylcysteine O-methyltransferase Ste14